MKLSFVFSLILASLIPFTLSSSVYARGNDFAISDGQGEMLQVKNPLFGKKVRVVKDRLGDGFAQRQGILGGSDSEYSVLGNKVQKHKGILGNSEMSGSTIFGDRIVSRKGIFGRRKTAVDISGSSNLIKSLIGHPGGRPYPAYNGGSANLAPPAAPPLLQSMPTGN